MKLSPVRHLQKGFTLIELLVVIGILGILAAALVATIDPFEQLKKADDSKLKNLAVEFSTANVRYYTTHGAFPWSDGASTNANCMGLSGPGQNTTPINQAPLGIGILLTNCIGTQIIPNSLIGEGELKKSFNTAVNDLNKLYLNWSVTDTTNMGVCFSPKSKSQKAAPDTKFDRAGVINAACPDSQAADNVCYWCTQ